MVVVAASAVIAQLLRSAAWQHSQQAPLPAVTILHFNDAHGRIEASDIKDVSPCSTASVAAQQCFGGFTRLAAQVAFERRRQHPVLLLNAGDEMMGGIWDVVYSGQASPPFLNAMGVDAMALGNHDFGHGIDALASFIAACAFPVLAPCNMDATAHPELAGKLQDHAIKDLGSFKVALVAYLSPSTAHTAPPGHNITFTAIIPALTARIRSLQATRPDVKAVIALGHAGYHEDLVVAASVPGLSMVVGSHSHTLLANSPVVLEEATRSTQLPAGPYPTWVTGPGGRAVPVVQAYCHTRYLGKADVTFGAEGQVVGVSGGPILLNAATATSSRRATPESTVAELVTRMGQPVHTYARAVIGRFAQPGARLDHANRRYGDTPVGNMVTQAMLWYTATHTSVETTAGPVTIAWLNAGDIRGSLVADAPGSPNITRQALATVLPYHNTLAVKRVSGVDLLQSLERGVAGPQPPGHPTTGAFAAVWGLRYSYDWTLPVGARIIHTEVHSHQSCEDPTAAAPASSANTTATAALLNTTAPPAATAGDAQCWLPLDPCASYLVAMNDYAAAGGDGLAHLAAAPFVLQHGAPMDLVVGGYLAAASPVVVDNFATDHIGCCPHSPGHPLCASSVRQLALQRICGTAQRQSPLQ